MSTIQAARQKQVEDFNIAAKPQHTRQSFSWTQSSTFPAPLLLLIRQQWALKSNAVGEAAAPFLQNCTGRGFLKCKMLNSSYKYMASQALWVCWATANPRLNERKLHSPRSADINIVWENRLEDQQSIYSLKAPFFVSCSSVGPFHIWRSLVASFCLCAKATTIEELKKSLMQAWLSVSKCLTSWYPYSVCWEQSFHHQTFKNFGFSALPNVVFLFFLFFLLFFILFSLWTLVVKLTIPKLISATSPKHYNHYLYVTEI